MNNNKGFTVLELLILMAVTVTLSQIATKSFTSVESRKINSVSLNLQSEVRNAKNRSSIENISYRIFFSISNNRYSVYRDGVLQKHVYLPEGIWLEEVTARENSVSFTPVGTTGDASTIVLRGKEFVAILTINVGAGRVSIKELKKIDTFGN